MQEYLSNIDTKYKFWGTLLVSGLVRLLKIDSRPIWYDEAFSLLFSPLDIQAMFRGTIGTVEGQVAENHPLGYYLLLGRWMDLLGDTVWSARLLSVLFGVLTIGFLMWMAIKFENNQGYWLIGVFVAISPFHVHYSQEIRMYAMMAFFLVTAALSLFRAMDRDGWYWWVIFALSSAAAQYTQQLSAVFLICLALIPVLKRDIKAVIMTLLAGLGAIVLYIPWLIYLPGQLATTEVYWVKRPLISRFLTLFLAYVAGLPVQGIWLWVGFVAAIIIVVFGSLRALRIWRTNGRNISGLWYGYLAFSPPVLLWLISQFRPVYIERALLASAVFFSAWVAWLVSHKSTPNFEKYLLAGFFLIGSVIGVFTHLMYEGFSYARFEEIGRSIESRRNEDEIIVHSNKLSYLPMYYYFEDEIPQQFIADAEGSATDTLHPETQVVLGFMETEGLFEAVGDARGIWFLIYQRAIDEAEEKGFVTHPHLEWLESHFEIASEERWGDLWLLHYRRGSE